MKLIKAIRRITVAVLSAAVLLSATACAANNSGSESGEDGKLSIISTVFPPYDFAKQITGDKADLKILLPPGNETHTYEPSPSDIIAIQNCDIFLYIGGENELWADKILSSADTSGIKIVKLIDTVTLLSEEDEHEQHEAEEHDGHEHEYDQHIWTSPANAKIMLNAICDAVCEVDSENADYYKKNKDSYEGEITALQNDIKTAVDNAKNKTVIFGDRFPFRYFANEFGLDCYAAFSSCSDESEPRAATVTMLIDKIKELGIPVVYYLEFSSRKVADTLCEQTGAQSLMLHSCHNVSKDDLDSGATYVSLMRQNLENLKICLNGKE